MVKPAIVFTLASSYWRYGPDNSGIGLVSGFDWQAQQQKNILLILSQSML